MTVRLPEELDAALSALAAERHVSKSALLIEAVDRFTKQESKTERVLANVDETTRDYAELLKRLEDA